MNRSFTPVLSAACLCMFGTLGVSADDAGLNRGLGAAANGVHPRPMVRSGDPLPRPPMNPPNSTTDLGRKLNGLQRGRGGLEHITPPNLGANPRGVPAPNQNRIYEHRLQQADHLRELSIKNGNENLAGAADRMDANAARNFERQAGIAPPAPPQPEAPVDGQAVQTTSPPKMNFDTALRPKRGFWLRAR